jgi:hypothetical protein
LVELPQSLLFQILDQNSLRIGNDRQLVDFLDAVDRRKPLAPEKRLKLSELIEWQFLTEADWDSANWRLFIDDDKKERFLELRRKFDGSAILVNIRLALQDGRMNTLKRYYPPIVETFGLNDDFFDKPEKYHVNGTLLDKKGPEIVIAMTGRAGICFSKINITVSVYRNVDMLTLIWEPMNGKQSTNTYIGANIEGIAVFDLKIENPVIASKLTLRFTVQDQKRFTITSIQAEGFSFVT